MNQITFQRSCVEQLNFMPRSVTKPLWEGRINTLLDDMTQNEGSIVEVSEDASVNGRFYAYLDEFCTSLQQAQDREEILLRRPYTDEKEEKTFFRLVDLENHLVKANFKNYKTHQIAQRLRDINGEATQINIKGKSVRVWMIPAFNRINPDIPPPNFGDEKEVPF